MVEATDVSHEDADLAIIDFAAVTTPLALDPHRMRPPLGKTARIKGDDAIGFAEPLDDLSNQHLDQRPVVPGCGANAFLHDLSLHLDEHCDVLGILAGQVRQQPAGGRDGRCVARPRFPAPVDRAPRTRPDGPPSDGTRRGTPDNRSTIPLAVVPTPMSSFRLHK